MGAGRAVEGVMVESGNQAVVPVRHGLFDDLQALGGSVLLLGLSILFFRDAGLLTGGVTGMSFVLHYASGLPFGAIFFVLNLPFYVFAWWGLGRSFTLRTFVAVGVLSVCIEGLPHLVAFSRVEPVFAAVMGGLLAGTGILMLVRHRASLGGVGVLALYLQQRRGWRAGFVQMAVDCVILASALWVVAPERVALSVLGALVLNVVIAVNHRPGRYVGI
ncbi:MAG: YitT family protein [Rhodocyclaceae bacterium]|nr:YitT family protein [Rhodocyclaceae bacterium]